MLADKTKQSRDDILDFESLEFAFFITVLTSYKSDKAFINLRAKYHTWIQKINVFWNADSCPRQPQPWAMRAMWGMWNEADTVYQKRAEQELFPDPRSAVIPVCCLTVNRAGKWQWLDVVAPATHSPSWATQRAILHTLFHKFPQFVSICVAASYGNYSEKNVLTESKELLYTISKGLAVDSSSSHESEVQKKKVHNWAKKAKRSVPNISVVKLNTVMRSVARGLWLIWTCGICLLIDLSWKR